MRYAYLFSDWSLYVQMNAAGERADTPPCYLPIHNLATTFSIRSCPTLV